MRDVEVDEIWSFIQKKEGNKPEAERENEMIGDAYTFVGMESHTKLVLAWHLGRRNAVSTMLFMRKLRTAVNLDWFQLTTDGFPPYPSAVAYQFGQHVKFRNSRENLPISQRRRTTLFSRRGLGVYGTTSD